MEHTTETVEVLTNCEAVTVSWTVTGSGLEKALCTKDVKRRVNGERCASETGVVNETRDSEKRVNDRDDIAIVEKVGTRFREEKLEEAPPRD